ncbi:MAG: hypothetical protein HC768_21830 [Acaryochloris sp. CRU_2_0]|nr:hypothetical protein [Acaryochloris sp. CRU_2_0]
MVQALQPERILNQTPLFQIKLILQNTEQQALEIPGLTLIPLPIEETTAPFDLVLSMKEGRDHLVGTVTYNKALFDTTTITQLLQRFQTLLENIVSDPDTPIADLNLLTEEEKNQLTQVQMPAGVALSQKNLERLMLELGSLS